MTIDNFIVIVPVYNRPKLTFDLLKDLSIQLSQFSYKIILIDASDNNLTKEIVAEIKNVIRIKVPANYYWSKSIRVGQIYSQNFDWNYMILVNDDIKLFKNSFKKFTEKVKIDNNKVYVGSFVDNFKNTTYGLRDSNNLISAYERKKGKYMNGNFVFISRNIFDNVGVMPKWLKHSIGDFVYGLMCIKSNYSLNTMGFPLGVCLRHEKPEIWQDENETKINRLKNLFEPKGLDYLRYVRFVLFFDREKVIKKILSPLFKVLFS